MTLSKISALFLLAGIYASQAATDPWQALPQYQFGQSREPLSTIEEQIRKSGPSERVALEQRLLGVLQSPATTKDSRRFICRWLGLVGTEKSVAPLATLLTDPDLAHSARIGLERLAYPSAGDALVAALPKVKGNLLVGVISSIGAKRVAGAVPELANVLKSDDVAVVQAALAALGQIGTEAAGRVLASAKVAPALTRDLARARISAARRLADAGQRPAAAAVFKELMGNAAQPPAIRVAALQGLAATLPPNEAATLIMNALESNDPVMRSAAVKAFASAGAARDSLAARLPGMQPRSQLLLLGILADAPEVAARQPLLEVAQATTDSAVKAAAVDCLAIHGQADDVAPIARWAATGDEPVKAAARKTLQRIAGPGVDAALLRLIESADLGQRQAVMEALPSRRMQTALPVLDRLARGSDPAIAAAAARTLGQMGGTAQIKGLAQVMIATPNDNLRAAAQEAIKTLCTRVEDKAACAGIIQAELENATSPAARAALLPLTVYTGGEAGLAQVLKGLDDPNSEVRGVAFRTLVAWPEARAAAPLLRFAETNQSSQAVVALRDGCLRLAEVEEVPAAERAAILRRVTQVARRPEEKRRAVSLMAQVPAVELLDFLPQLAADAGLRNEAMASTVQLARSLGAVYPRPSLAALEQVLKQADTPELRQAVENGIKAVRSAGLSPDGRILGWMVAGPFTAPDKDGSALFDVAFPPEKSGAQVAWRPVSAPSNGMVDLGKFMPGENRVAYLRATLSSEQAQKALLELGSDDGIKVWLNGEVVHANNAVRPCAPAQDKATLNLKQGDNVLLLKVTQGGGEWAAIARLRAPDGKPLSNVMVGAAKE